jgi:endonuclease/exonuclease/phosphatase family metal-dependent hydrolase
MRLSVVSWNIHKGIGGMDRRYRIDRVVGVLAELAPDVALLQEVTDGLPRASFHDQAELLGEALGMEHVAFCAQHRFAIGGYGNAILSRFPITRVDELDLTIGTRKRRGALGAHLRVRVGTHTKSVVLWNLHLGLAGSERGAQLERFLESPAVGRTHHPTPVIVGGDFNDLWGSLGPRFLLPAGFVRVGRLENTFPAAVPLRPLDGIFVRGGVRAHACNALRSPLTRQASDHLPLCAKLEIASDP